MAQKVKTYVCGKCTWTITRTARPVGMMYIAKCLGMPIVIRYHSPEYAIRAAMLATADANKVSLDEIAPQLEQYRVRHKPMQKAESNVQ